MSNTRSVILASIAAAAGALGVAAALSTATAPTARADDIYPYLPDTSTFIPTSALGYPPLIDVLQGDESWRVPSLPVGESLVFQGVDTHTVFGSFTNDDFLVNGEGIANGTDAVALFLDSGSEIDYVNFGGGFANEWINATGTFLDPTDFTTDILITPFGNFTLF